MFKFMKRKKIVLKWVFIYLINFLIDFVLITRSDIGTNE